MTAPGRRAARGRQPSRRSSGTRRSSGCAVRAARGRRDLREARVAQSRRLGQGPRGAGDDARRRAARRARSRPRPARRHVRQHRHRLRHARRGARLSRAAVRAGERDARATRRAAAYGADLVLTDPMDGSDGAIREARRIYAERPDAYFYPDQYSNPANWRAHYETTGARSSSRRTGGSRTSSRVSARAARSSAPAAGCASGATRCSSSPCSRTRRSTGSKASSTWRRPSCRHLRSALADEDLRVATEDAHALTRRLAREEGLFVGPSSGAALAACLESRAGSRRASS